MLRHGKLVRPAILCQLLCQFERDRPRIIDGAADVQIRFALLDLLDAAEGFPDLAKLGLLVQLCIDVAHLSRQDRLCSVWFVRVATRFPTPAKISTPIVSFRDMAVRRSLLIANKRNYLLQRCSMLRVLVLDGVLPSDIPVIFFKPLAVDSLNSAVRMDASRLLCPCRIHSRAVDWVIVEC